MSIRIFRVVNADGETVMTLQGKQERTMLQAIEDYIACGRLPVGKHHLELVGIER